MKRLLLLAVLGLVPACGNATTPSASQPLSGFGVDNGAGLAKSFKIEIRKGLEIHGEFASIQTAAGDELDSMKCDFSVAVDFDKWTCSDDSYDLELGKIVTSKAPMGTMTAGNRSFDVTCKVATSGPNGVDGPVLEYTCDAKLAAQ